MVDVVINRRKLRRLRLDMGWTQKDLERESGVRRSTISKIETGERMNLRTTTLQALARALGVTADELLIRPPQPSALEVATPDVRLRFAIVKRLEVLSEEDLEQILSFIDFVKQRANEREAKPKSE